jgi:D-ribose pyranase
MARIGHRDRYAIVDAGYNVPAGIECVDLAFLPNIPTILQVLDGIQDEMVIEGVILASEIKEWSPEMDAAYAQRWAEGVQVTYIPHSEFDKEIQHVKAVIRTGQYGLHAPNIILQGGCTY